MPNNLFSDRIVRNIAIWLIFSTALGTIIAFYVSLQLSIPFWKLLIGILIATYCISLFSAVTGRVIGVRLRHKSYPVAMLINVPVTLLAALIAGGIALFLVYAFIGPVLFSRITDKIVYYLVPLVIINIIISLALGWISHQKYRREVLERNIQKIQAELAQKDEPDRDFLLIRESGSLYRLPYGDIVYLSSHGKKTLAHTEDRDYEISSVMKKIDDVLPDGIFMRIHKQFIVNMRYISHIQYYLGGRYLLYLKDKDENTLPVGIKYTKAVKNMLGL